MSYDQNPNQNAEPNNSRPNYESPNFYGTPNTPYGNPGTFYRDPAIPYGASIPPKSPLPLGDAIRELPNQYIRVITKPGTTVFAEEQGKAAWNIVWVQLIILAIISTLVNFITLNTSFNTYISDSLNTSAASQQVLQILRSYSGAFAILCFILAPILFFIFSGIYYLIAKAFGGRGTYLAYCYSYLLLGVPLGIITGVLGLIPFVGSFLAFPVSIYDIVLQVFMTMAVHRLTGDKATLVVLILPIAVFVLACIAIIIIVATIIGSAYSH